MAKKKNTPVLRGQSEGGDQPISTTVTKSYAVRDKWLDKAKDNLVEFKSVDGVISDLKVNGEPAGGGGMKTANVLISNNSGADVRIVLPIIPNPDFPNINLATMFEASPTDHTVKVVLNTEGQTLGSILDQVHDAYGDDGVEVFNGMVAVTGDGTLTLE